ncbi:hypothetical protein [Bradyrhizobium sp. AUGA SZCCT0042]|uniref:hypothetical protein n=1 Tax=Bradyrhizobium sp. AUGA SZCCT0042 TaxID=2807651 RepID=UPI001BA978E0|nr:hypothetical protein [Bradyrhizobium sp. AUGA SZCCT0042]MBR1298549.1 hypothetical protein [Bradyrhizobium sp. AUGA SZCCT0042]
MAYEHRAILEAQYAQLAAQRALAVADMEAGRMSEDDYSTMSAADRIIEADMKRSALDGIARNYAVQQQQPRGNRFGLSADEVSIAHGIAGGDPNISNEQREQVYAHNRDKLRHLRAIGAYRDDQGSR